MINKKTTIKDLPAIRPLGLFPEEVEVIEPRDRPLMDEWAEENFYLSELTSNISGQYSLEYTPWMAEIMQKLSQPGPVIVTIMGCSQMGKSLLGCIFKGYVTDVCPGPFGLLLPRETDVETRINTRIRTMFAANKRLRRHLPGGRVENLNIGKETIYDNMIFYPMFANSAAAVADKSLKYGHADEVGKFPPSIGKEASPLKLFDKRFRTYKESYTQLITSTPVYEGDLIDSSFKRGDKRRLWGRCPHCGEFHILTWAHRNIDKNEYGQYFDSEHYKTSGRAKYACPNCGVLWDEGDRWQAVTKGVWCPDGFSVNSNGKIEGKVPYTNHFSYQVNFLMLHPAFSTVEEKAYDWVVAIKAKDTGDIQPLKDFKNSEEGTPWVDIQSKTDEEVLKGHIGNYFSQIAPVGVQIITAGIDVQIDHFYVYVIGWGHMSRAWSMFEARLESGDTKDLASYDILEEFLKMDFSIAGSDKRMVFNNVGIDCQYNTDTVFDFCSKCTWAPIIPVRGDDAVKAVTIRPKPIKEMGLIRYDLNLYQLKNRIYRILHEQQVPGEGYMYLHRETEYDVLRQLCSEECRTVPDGRKVKKIWMPKDPGLANHYWDCAVYATAAAEIAGARMLKDPANIKPRRKLSEIIAERRNKG